jgi:hypothetical protein
VATGRFSQAKTKVPQCLLLKLDRLFAFRIIWVAFATEKIMHGPRNVSPNMVPSWYNGRYRFNCVAGAKSPFLRGAGGSW